jgi:hypothetical protein
VPGIPQNTVLPSPASSPTSTTSIGTGGAAPIPGAQPPQTSTSSPAGHSTSPPASLSQPVSSLTMSRLPSNPPTGGAAPLPGNGMPPPQTYVLSSTTTVTVNSLRAARSFVA